MTKGFIKNKEDFTCERCGAPVFGNGYTNHCTKCLWSKHVDKDPGDRLEGCGGMMEPVSVEKKGSDYVITHVCLKCRFERRDSVRLEDDFDAVVALSKKIADRISQGK